jgi:hypothetical protein
MTPAETIFRDPATAAARAAALAWFVDRGANYWDSAVHLLLPAVFAHLRQTPADTPAWTIAAQVLDMEIDHAIKTKESA